jgi:integrase
LGLVKYRKYATKGEKTVERKIEEFKDYLLEKERSQNTIESYMQSINMFYRMFGELNKKNMIEYKRWLLENRKPKTAAIRCMSMNVYCDFLGHPEYKVKSIKVHNRTSVENVITMDEYKYFLQCLKYERNDKLYFIIKFLAGTGCRASELVKLEKTCLSTGEFSMWSKGKVRKIIIPSSLIRESKEYFATVDSRWLFPNRYGNQMTTRGVAQQIKRHGQRYGIRGEVLHPHAFRHLFAILFLDKTKNLVLLSDILGHESVNTTAIYLRLTAEEQKKQIDNTVNW